MFAFFSPERKRFIAVLVFAGFLTLLGIGIFGFPESAEARGRVGQRVWTWTKRIVGGAAGAGAAYGVYALGSTIANALESWDNIFLSILQGLASWLGKIMLWLTALLIKVAQYNDFLEARAVEVGWVIVRDVANMFFVLILLVIAIATILRYEAYSWKQLLPKFFLMAVLINFSKTICGIIIDFGQVVMLTFVNAFAAAAGANFIQAFGIQKIFTFSTWAEQQSEGAEVGWDVMGQGLLAVVVLLVAAVTVGVLAIVLVIRIVVLWTLIILSPLAYLLATFPQGKEKAREWWDMFSKYVISGPVLAFFLWLALVVAGGGDANTQVQANFSSGELPSDMGDMGDPKNLSSFVVSVVLMLVGLMFTQKLGIAGSSVAGAALSGLRRMGTAPLRAARKGVSKGISWGWQKTKAGYNRLSDYTYSATGVALPLSERRKRAKAEIREKRLARREARGMAKTAVRVSTGGMRGLLATVVDPRAARGMSWSERWIGAFTPEGKRRYGIAADSLVSAMTSEARPADLLFAQRLEQKTKAAIGIRQALPQIKKRDALQEEVSGYERSLADQDKKIAETRSENDRRRAVLAAEREGINQMLGMSNEDLINDRAEKRFIKEREKAAKRGESLPAERLEEFKSEERDKVYREAMERVGKGASQEDLNREISNLLRKPLRGRLAEIDKEESGMTRKEKGMRQERDKLASALERANQELTKIRARLDNPALAREDALRRRNEALKAGDAEEVKKIDMELREIEQASGMIKVRTAADFFKLSYEEQLERAKKSAEGESESALAKKLAAALKDGTITKNDFDKFVQQWRDEGVTAARKSLEDYLKSKKATS